MAPGVQARPTRGKLASSSIPTVIISNNRYNSRGFCLGSHRPRARPPPVASFSLCDLRLFVIKRIFLSARVPLVVWAWDFLLCDFLAAVSRPLLAHCFSICDLRLFANKRMLLTYLR